MKNIEGASSIYVKNGYSKNLNISATNGSGSIQLEDGFCDYYLNATIKESAFKPLEGMPEYKYNTPYIYILGNSAAAIRLDVEKSSFSIEQYFGNATDLLENHYDVVF